MSVVVSKVEKPCFSAQTRPSGDLFSAEFWEREGHGWVERSEAGRHRVRGNSTWHGLEVGECDLVYAMKKEAHGFTRVTQDPGELFSLMLPGVGLPCGPDAFGCDIKPL